LLLLGRRGRLAWGGSASRPFDLTSPEMVPVGRSRVTTFTYPNSGSEQDKERRQDVSRVLIESLEPLDSPVHQPTQ
jgi:hypothetical protein